MHITAFVTASLAAALVLDATGALAFHTAGTAHAAPAPRPRRPARPDAKPEPAPTPEEQLQREADRHFQSGVALYKEANYSEALAEFGRAYEISPHPLVLYNIAECHRELL